MIDLKEWMQICGDVDPLAYGGTFARLDGWSIEIIEIQPVIDYVGRDAVDVGFPFWTRESYHNPADLRPEDNGDALACCGLDSDAPPLAIALARHQYGHAEEGPCGWASDLDIFRALGCSPEEIAECDADFREYVKDHS